MFIEPIECPTCHRRGRPGEADFAGFSEGQTHKILCACGNQILLHPPNDRDQIILSTNVLGRMEAMSNHREVGRIELNKPGTSFKITFKEPFDFVCNAFFSPNQPVTAKELFMDGTGMTVLSSIWEGREIEKLPVSIDWNVVGLKEIDRLPNWYVLFYGAMANAFKGLYKPALLDYATCFEAFLEEFLMVRLSARYGQELAEMLMKRMWRIEDRSKDVLQIAIGHRLTERPDVYQPWEKHVRNPRNSIMHGEKIVIDKNSVEQAHQAVYQAIRWIEQNDC